MRVMQSNPALHIALASLVFVPALLSAELWERGDQTRALVMLLMTAAVAVIAGLIALHRRESD
jgi:hypothetical protein